MPLVLVTRNPKITDEALKPLLGSIRLAVAAALSTAGEGALTPNDIEVKVQEIGPLDQNIRDVSIIIWANNYPARLENLDARRRHLADQIKILVRAGGSPSLAITGSLWILLAPGSYEEW